MVMREIIFNSPGYAVFEECECKECIKETEVLVKTVYTLISNGTEKAYLCNEKNTGHKFPKNIGYSAVGYVVKVGEKVKSVKNDDRVFVEYGGHSSVIVKDIKNVIKIPDGVSFEDAVFTKIASFPLGGVRRSRIELGECCTVVGLGMLGLFGVQLARIAGAYPIIGVGNREFRKNMAKELGADYVFDSSTFDLVTEINRLSEEITGIKGASVVIETSGSENGLQKALEYSAKRGRIMLVGCNREMKEPIDVYKYIHKKGVEVIGAHGQVRSTTESSPHLWSVRRDYLTILNYMKKKYITTDSIISEFVDPKQCTEIYARLLSDREFPMGVIFDWQKYEF